MSALVTALLRLVGRVHLAIADEIDRACSTYAVEIPDVIPAWLDEEVL